MASFIIKKMKPKRLSYDFSGCYVFILTLLEVLGKTHMSVHDNNHAAIEFTTLKETQQRQSNVYLTEAFVSKISQNRPIPAGQWTSLTPTGVIKKQAPQDFIQANNNDVRFMGVHEGLQVFMQKAVTSSGVRISQVHKDFDGEDAFSTSTYLKFVPPRLDFKESVMVTITGDHLVVEESVLASSTGPGLGLSSFAPGSSHKKHLGVPHLEKVTLVNTDDNKTIHMSSVSGNTLHFHSSFFQDKTIPPKGNTTFAVVFLGRVEGQVSSSLYIHTSEGIFKYQVSGASVGSPYRLRPLGGVRLPLNAAFQPLIHLHNPHHYPIQVVEVYSSGSEFHLELPGGELEGPKTLWEVPPYTTKPVIRAKFQANAQSNHTAYIRLKLNNSEEVLVVPLEVEVTSQPGLYSQPHFIDFGIGGSQDEPKKLILYLCSSIKKTLRIQSVTAVPASSALKINFEGVKIPAGASHVAVAELVFDWKVAFETKQTSGKIVIKSKQNQYKLGIPFTATILEGGLKINESATRFLTTDSQHPPRNLTVINEFRIPIAVNNVSVLEGASKYFQIRKFKPVIIPPNKSAVLLTIAPKESTLKELKLESGLVLFTNVSDISVSILSYNGKLTKIFPRGFEDLELLDVGLVGSGSTKSLRFGLQNNNPVTIELKGLLSNSPFIMPKMLGVFRGNASEFLSQYSFANLTNSTKLKPNGIAVVELVVQASKNEEMMSSQITVLSQYEKLTIPVRVSVAHGSLEMIPKQITLDNCFPGKICTQPLKIQSTFNRPMTATSITSVPPDPRMSFSGTPGNFEILPNSSNYIGDLKWEPGKNCGAHCYLGISLNSSGSGLQWMQSELLSPYVSDMDATLLRDRYHRLLNLTNGHGSGHWQEILLRLDTNEVREELFKARVRLIWPKFSNTSKLTFPLTQVTNTTVQRLKLYNSASHMIVVQLVTEWAYPQAKRLLDSFPPRLNLGGHCFNSPPKEFYIAQKFPEPSEPHGKLNTTLAPGESYEVTIAYTPRSPQKSCSLLFIRNNLTVIEVIELNGQAAYAQLKFGNRKPGSENPLTFEIAEKHLKDCNREKNKKYSPPNLTVKRSFTIRNVGDLPVYVHSFYINGLECEGYGFSVLNCGPFHLPANGTRKIDIAFTPDFTLTKVQRTLKIRTSLGVEVNYTLITTLPPYFLSACSSVLSRPSWEPLLYYSAVSFMMFLLFCVLAAAFFESDRILKCALMSLARDRVTVPLDLRQIRTNVLKEFSQNTLKKLDGSSEQSEKGKQREGGGNSGGWSAPSSEERHFGSAQKEDTHMKSDDSLEYKEKESNTSNSPGTVQLNNIVKHKKKLNKKNSNSSDTQLEQEAVSGKKKEKSFSNSGWCSVFSRGSSNSTEKIKLKLNAVEGDNIKQIRNDIETKKEDGKKEEKKQNKVKKALNKEPNKEEEETSSIMTDSSNDAEKENSDALSRLKSDKLRKIPNKDRKDNVLECKDINYEVDCEYEDFEKEKKTIPGKNSWKVNSKAGKFLNTPESSINIWKPNSNDGQKNSDFVKHKVNKSREKKEKTGNKRRLGDKTTNPKSLETSAIHHSSPCWEHRSFSEVVARNDSPLLYSNIVSAKNNQHKPQVQPTSLYSESPKSCDSSISSLGPIGSKKPLSNWSPIPYSATSNQNIFNMAFAEPIPNYLNPNPAAPDFTGEGSAPLEDSLPIDPENLWEDQHAVMQLMHQQDSSYTMSWKENWLDYLWYSSRNVHQPVESLAPHDNYSDQSWGSLLRSPWGSPTPWSPSTSQSPRPPAENNLEHHFGSYHPLAEAESVMGHELQAVNLNAGPNGGMLNQGLFHQNAVPRQLPRSHSRENIIEEVLEMMDSVYPEPLSRLHRRAVRKKFHKNSARYRTQPVTFAEIQEVDEEQITEDTQNTAIASKSELDLKAKFEEFKRQRDRDLCEIRLTSNGVDNAPEVITESKVNERTSNSKGNDNRDSQSVVMASTCILPYRGSSIPHGKSSRTSV